MKKVNESPFRTLHLLSLMFNFDNLQKFKEVLLQTSLSSLTVTSHCNSLILFYTIRYIPFFSLVSRKVRQIFVIIVAAESMRDQQIITVFFTRCRPTIYCYSILANLKHYNNLNPCLLNNMKSCTKVFRCGFFLLLMLQNYIQILYQKPDCMITLNYLHHSTLLYLYNKIIFHFNYIYECVMISIV